MSDIFAADATAQAASTPTPPSRALDGHRRDLLVIFVLAMGWLLFWYRDTLMAMVDIWDRSDTFAHGYVVAPISLWLAWRIRERFFLVDVRPSWLGLLAGAACGFVWLAGEIASVNAAAQFALVGMIISLVWAVLGTSVLRAFAFPLAFLVFMVPFGEFLFPMMMDWTTHFVVGALRATGVPVYAEGRSLVIPSGHWQVVEGCSGVRYLIASIVVGWLYAYLNYRSLTKRLVFVLASVVMPVVANWFRAYLIVLIGHLSNNKLATGVDHIVYGWVFFGIVIVLLFMVGARWRDDFDPVEVSRDRMARQDRPAVSRATVAAMSVVTLVGLLAWKPVLAVLDARVSSDEVKLVLPTGSSGWQPVSLDAMAEWTPSYSGMRGTFRAAYAAGAEPVGTYVAYYRHQGPGEELINSENRILISKDKVWKETAYGTQTVALGDAEVKVRFVDMRSGPTRQIVWMTYWVGNRWTTSDIEAKIYLAISKLLGRGDDSAAVMFYTQFQGEERAPAEQRLAAFVGAFGPELAGSLDAEMDR